MNRVQVGEVLMDHLLVWECSPTAQLISSVCSHLSCSHPKLRFLETSWWLSVSCISVLKMGGLFARSSLSYFVMHQPCTRKSTFEMLFCPDLDHDRMFRCTPAIGFENVCGCELKIATLW